MGVSLWLAPAEATPAYSELNSLIGSLAPNPSLRFTPHVTLLTNLPPLPSFPLPSLVSAIRSAIANSLTTSTTPTLDLPFAEVVTSGSFFQCVLIRLVRTPALQQLHESVRTALRPPNAPAADKAMGKVLEGEGYFPHLSLVYADIDDAAKKAVVKRLVEEGAVTPGEHAGCSVKGLKGVEATEVLVVQTEGPPVDWRVLERIPLATAR